MERGLKGLDWALKDEEQGFPGRKGKGLAS